MAGVGVLPERLREAAQEIGGSIIEENRTDCSRQMAGGFVGLMSGGLLGIGFGVVAGDLGVGMLFVAAFAAAGAYVFPRSDFVNIANRHEKELEELGDRLVELAAGS